MKGTPYAEVQKELHKRGLHDPWMRKWYFSYDGIMRRPYTLVSKPLNIACEFAAILKPIGPEKDEFCRFFVSMCLN